MFVNFYSDIKVQSISALLWYFVSNLLSIKLKRRFGVGIKRSFMNVLSVETQLSTIESVKSSAIEKCLLWPCTVSRSSPQIFSIMFRSGFFCEPVHYGDFSNISSGFCVVCSMGRGVAMHKRPVFSQFFSYKLREHHELNFAIARRLLLSFENAQILSLF